ncbi:hypothetical protein BHM03_00041502 [Ensete ventricosum]|nr:hypothetical protein BHM03_00041502 [Ensete ventricosum]
MKLFVCAASLTIKPRHKHNPTGLLSHHHQFLLLILPPHREVDEVTSQSSGFSTGPHTCANKVMPRVQPESKDTVVPPEESREEDRRARFRDTDPKIRTKIELFGRAKTGGEGWKRSRKSRAIPGGGLVVTGCWLRGSARGRGYKRPRGEAMPSSSESESCRGWNGPY